MRVSRRFLCIMILSILFCNLIINAKASNTNYLLGINVGDEYIWQVSIVDEYSLKKVISLEILNKNDYRLGVQMKIVITGIDIKGDEWFIYYDLWPFTKYEFKVNPYPYGDRLIILNMNPVKYGTGLYSYYYAPLDYKVSFFYPIPLTTYLKEAYKIKAHYKMNETTLTYTESLYKVNFYFDNDSGILTTINYVLNNGTKIYEFSLIDKLPNYYVPTILGIIPIIMIGIIYLIMKKKHIF